MRLLKVDSIEEARDKLLIPEFEEAIKTEIIDLKNAYGKILAKDLIAQVNVPEFRRSTVDGYAVKAKETMGASESLPVFLDLVGQVEMGANASQTLASGQAIYVPTGGMLPEGADAMVMVEYCEPFDESSIAVYKAVAPGTNLVNAGDDVKKGQVLLKVGRKLKSQEIGVLSSLGLDKVEVFKPLRISIFSSGDELVEAGQALGDGQVYDINTNAIYAEAIEIGMEVVRTGIVRDIEEEIHNTLEAARLDSDIVVISGGSSQGKKDMTGDILDRITDGHVMTRGLALKPGKPSITAFDYKTKTFLFGLPGHPVASLLVFKLLVKWLNKRFFNCDHEYFIEAQMQSTVASDPGKNTCQMLEIEECEDGYKAYPVFGKSGLMTTLTKSQAYTLIDRNKEGLKAGETVRAYVL